MRLFTALNVRERRACGGTRRQCPRGSFVYTCSEPAGRKLCEGDEDRGAQETSVAIVEEFVRHSGVRSVDDLQLLDERGRQWWTEGEGRGLDPKQVCVRCAHLALSLFSNFLAASQISLLKLLVLAKAKASVKDADASKADTANADETRSPGALQRLATPARSPSKTQPELVAETPQPSLDGDQNAGAPGKRVAFESPHASPQHSARGSRAAASADNEGAMHGVTEGPPNDATGARGAGASSGDKRLREHDAGGEGGCVPPQDQDRALDAQVESHRRGAEQSYKVYHDLLAKRARLTREVRRLAAHCAACRAWEECLAQDSFSLPLAHGRALPLYLSHSLSLSLSLSGFTNTVLRARKRNM